MKSRNFIYLILLLPLLVKSQDNSTGNHAWQLTNINGAAKIEGLYRNQESTTNGIYDYQKSSLIYAGLMLNTSSYVWHPNFLTLDIGGEYNPEKRQDLFLVVPDQAEAVTMKKLDMSATFFKQKPINLNIFANYNESYNNRENLSNIRTDGSTMGANFSFSNKILPITAGYHHSKWKETEIETGRSYTNEQKNFQAVATKSFSTHDNTELVYSHDDFDRIDASIYHVNNKSDYLVLNNNIAFDRSRKYFLNSNLSQFNQTGNDTFKRSQLNELLSMSFVPQLNASAGYSYIDNRRLSQDLVQQSISASLRHSLYNDLTTSLFYEYNNVSQTYYSEVNNKEGIDIRYEKSLPAKGRLILGYNFYNQNQKRTSESQVVQILNEQHILKDGEMVLLTKPYVELNSVLVKDLTGTIIYQPGFDYVLIERNNFVEIQRMPGGQIANNSPVFIDYLSTQPGSYQYDARFNQISASVMFLNRLVEVYYRRAKQDYRNLHTTEYLTLNYFTQNLYGIRLEYKSVNGGVEYDNYESSVIPYKLIRYFIQMQGSFKNNFLYSLNGNYRDYKEIDDETNQKYADVSGNLAYMFTPVSKLNFELGYRKQVGNAINLDLLTLRTEFTTSYRQLFFKVGVELYRRTYLNEDVNFNGAYFKIIRNFSWYKK